MTSPVSRSASAAIRRGAPGSRAGGAGVRQVVEDESETARSNGGSGGGSASRSRWIADHPRVGAGRQLLAGDLEHAGRRVGQHELADVPGQRQAEQPGARPYLDRPHVARQRNRGTDHVRDGIRPRAALRSVPGPCSLVEGAHVRMMPGCSDVVPTDADAPAEIGQRQ
jgi:hypothetical protein